MQEQVQVGGQEESSPDHVLFEQSGALWYVSLSVASADALTKVSSDIATLSRMTGKDFSGPTPVIKAPITITSSELQLDAPDSVPTVPPRKKKSRTPSARGLEAGVEILGDIDDIEGLDKDD